MARQVESWKDVTDTEVESAIEVLCETQRRVVPVDCDGDYTVQLVFIDRRKFEPLPFFCVPYRDDDKAGHEEAILTNLDMALEALRKFRQIEGRK